MKVYEEDYVGCNMLRCLSDGCCAIDIVEIKQASPSRPWNECQSRIASFMTEQVAK